MDAATGLVVPMKVLLVADVSAERLLGGAERMLMRHVQALADKGAVTVLTRQPTADAPQEIEVANGVTEYRLAFSGDRGIAGMRQLLRQAKIWWQRHQGEFDAVVSEQPFVMWALLWAGCRLPRLHVCHSFAFEEYATRHALKRNLKHKITIAMMQRLEKRVYGAADQLLVLSEYMRRRLEECFRLNGTAVVVAPGGVDMPTLASQAERESVRRELGWHDPVAITLRNLVPRTGVDMLVQAAAMLRYEMPGLRWCVMGDGELLEPLKWLAAQLDVAERIEFTGYLPESEVTKRMQAADVFVLPTRSLEGFGLVTIEANAHGLPVAATPAGANPEVAGASADNIVADAITPEALAEAVQALFAQHAESAVRAKRLHAHVRQHYNWQQHDVAFLRAVESL